jgi:hypothetical protein
VLLQATGEHELEEAVASLIQQSAAALIVSGDAMVYGQRAQIAELALKIPTSCPYRDQTAAGCLMSHGANVSETFRQAGNYVGRVLKAKSPPICRSTADQIRAGHQSQDSEGARPRRSANLVGRQVADRRPRRLVDASREHQVEHRRVDGH